MFSTYPVQKKDALKPAGAFRNPRFQAKLEVGQTDDEYEKEADAVADRIMMEPIKDEKDETLQMQSNEEDEMLQMQSIDEEDKMLQMQLEEEDETLQMQSDEKEVIRTKQVGTTTREGARTASPEMTEMIVSAKGGGSSLDTGIQREMGGKMGASFNDVRVHTDNTAKQLNQDLGAKAFTVGRNIFFNEGQYNPASGEGKRLMAHELTHVMQQTGDRSDGSSESNVVRKAEFLTSRTTPAIQRDSEGEQTDLQRLDALLDRWFVPQRQVVQLIGNMNEADRRTIATSALYKRNLTSALNYKRMIAVVRLLPLDLSEKLAWVEASAFMVRLISYDEIRPLVSAAPQSERDVLNTNRWRQFFVRVCTNRTMVVALNDLDFELATKLEWLEAEVFSVRLELSYSTIQPWITAASQSERDALNTNRWRQFFVRVCTNRTMVVALNDLDFELVTKLEWLEAEVFSARMELSYSTIQPWITAAPQSERDALNTERWKQFFVRVCTNRTMVTAVTDLGLSLQDKLLWLMAEGCFYSSFRNIITADNAAERATTLANQNFLHQLKEYFSFWRGGWNNFARCVELLGRRLPGGQVLLGNATVRGALANAWTDSNPAIVGAPPAPAPANLREQGGYIYLDVIEDSIATERAPAGAQASIPLNNPSPEENAITVGAFHTHPNVGPAWGAPHASGADINWAVRNGVPLLLRGAFPTVANTSDDFTGPARQHVAGSRGFPGSSGGVAPQATKDGKYDKV